MLEALIIGVGWGQGMGRPFLFFFLSQLKDLMGPPFLSNK